MDLSNLDCCVLRIELAVSLGVPQTITILSQSAKLTFFGAQDLFDEAGFTMASIPVASFSASKIHDHVKMKYGYFEEPNEETNGKTFRQNNFGIDKLLQNYNSKLMNSIWGQYNLYAAHAFQKNNEGSSAIERIFDVPQVKDLWNIPTAHKM